jgi:PhnB protein
VRAASRPSGGAKIDAFLRFGGLPGLGAPDPKRNMHAAIRIGETTVLASDGPGHGALAFSGFALSLSAPIDAEAERLFAALSKGGQAHGPIISTLLASRVGQVADRFGVPWIGVNPANSQAG